MRVTTAWRSGVASDPGVVRSNNEDRVYVDDAAGIFLVVDGMGGRAAGELAAQLLAAHLGPLEGQHGLGEAAGLEEPLPDRPHHVRAPPSTDSAASVRVAAGIGRSAPTIHTP